MLLGTFVDEVWWPSCGKLRECTRVGYESAYRCHIQPKWADVDMESITANDIEEWLGSFNQAGAARKAWAVLRAILRLAYRKGVTDNDVTRREIRLPHLRRYEPRVLDARQVRRLLKGFYGHALEAWLLVSVCAGLRRCESVGIEWADLDLRRGIVTVKRSVQWVAGHETVTDPKTDQSRRTVALPRFAVKRLAQLRHGRTGRLVGDLNANQVAAHYTSWCQRMKLPCVPPRNLRHTFGTLAIAAGADISVVARQLGHSDIKTTARYYLRPDLSVLRSLQRAWERLIIGAAYLSVTLYQDSNWIIIRNGRMILIKFSGKIGSGSWDAVECPVKLASWYRPIVDLSTVCLVSNGQTARSLTARADGTIRVANMGNVGSNQDCVGTLCFPIP